MRPVPVCSCGSGHGLTLGSLTLNDCRQPGHVSDANQRKKNTHYRTTASSLRKPISVHVLHTCLAVSIFEREHTQGRWVEFSPNTLLWLGSSVKSGNIWTVYDLPRLCAKKIAGTMFMSVAWRDVCFV